MTEELRRLLDAYEAWPTENLTDSGMVKQEDARQELMEALFEHRAEIVAELEDLERIRQRTYDAALAKAQAGLLDCSTDAEGLTR